MASIVPISSINSKEDNYNYYFSYKLYKNQKKKRYQTLCYPISNTTVAICNTLFLNNNEINVIIGSYLSMWIKNPKDNFVSKTTILSKFEKECESYISSFFIDEKVSCNDYVLFICFFLFYKTPDILSVLVSICGNTSNILITKDKMDIFCDMYQVEKKFYQAIIELLEESKNIYPDSDKRAYDLKTFIMYMSDSFSILTSLNSIQHTIMKLTFDQLMMDSILFKRNYYYFKNNNYTIIPFKKETCSEKLYRIMFTNKPKPYYCNYSTKYPLEQEKAVVLYKIKSRFGYSKRNNSTFFYSLTPKSIKLQLHQTHSLSSSVRKSPTCKFIVPSLSV